MTKTAVVAFLTVAFAALPCYAQAAPKTPSPAAPLVAGSAPRAVPPAATAPASSAATGVASLQGLGANQFSTEPAAKAHCPADTLVWVNLGGSKAFHTAGDRFYGKTRHGAYMCQKEAEQTGFHAPGHRPSRTAAKSAGANTIK